MTQNSDKILTVYRMTCVILCRG